MGSDGAEMIELKYEKLCMQVCMIASRDTSAYHVIQVVLRAVWYEGTAQLFSLTEFKSNLF